MYLGGSLVDHKTTENKRNMRLLGATTKALYSASHLSIYKVNTYGKRNKQQHSSQ